MKKVSWIPVASWAVSGTAALLAIVAWGDTLSWKFGHLSTYLLFPLFGLLGFSVMWSQYIAGVMRRYYGADKTTIQTFLTVTGYFVLVCILMHPGLLWWQLWRDGFGLPPQSYLQHYVAPSLRWVALLGTLSLGILLAQQLWPFFSKKRWWPWVATAGNLAVVAIFYHGLRLGTQLQSGWFHWVWLFYGLTLVASLVYIYYEDSQHVMKAKEKEGKDL